MSDFKFQCPHCGQEIRCDTSYSGKEAPCPTCAKTLTIPPIPTTAQASSAPATRSSGVPPVLKPSSRRSSASAKSETVKGGYSFCAFLSLLCSVWVCFGFIPGIIFGHIARGRMRRNIFLKGEGMASAGLVISYFFLGLTLILSTAFFFGQRHNQQSIKVALESPEVVADVKSRIVDEVVAGQPSEEGHNMEGLNETTSTYEGRTGRTAVAGGSFGYMMKVLPNEPVSLNCEYSGNERSGHVFDVAVDDQIIATQTLYYNHPGHFFYVEYKIPLDLTMGKTQVRVEFQAHARRAVGVLYGCQILKLKPNGK